MAVQLKKDANEELMDQYGLAITNIDLVVDAERPTTLSRKLTKGSSSS